MKKISSLSLGILLASALSQPVCAQKACCRTAAAPEADVKVSMTSTGDKNWFDRHNIFNHLEGALTIGTTGIGLELATPVTKWVRLRAGYDYMPHFHFNSTYDVTAYADGKINDSNFGRIQQLMNDISGFDMQKSVTMQNTATLQSWKVLLDVFPIPNNNHWRITAGLYGGSRNLGKCINRIDEAPMLVSIGTYNHFYDMATAPDFVVKYSWEEKFLGIAYLDVDEAQKIQDTMLKYGRLGVHVGDHPDGTPYFMEPDTDGTLSARAIINTLRPYLGLGYEGGLSDDGRWKAGVDAGVLFWGGAPEIVTHDGTVLNDLSDMRHKVKRQMDLIKSFSVYPQISFRLSYTFF